MEKETLGRLRTFTKNESSSYPGMKADIKALLVAYETIQANEPKPEPKEAKPSVPKSSK